MDVRVRAPAGRQVFPQVSLLIRLRHRADHKTADLIALLLVKTMRSKGVRIQHSHSTAPAQSLLFGGLQQAFAKTLTARPGLHPQIVNLAVISPGIATQGRHELTFFIVQITDQPTPQTDPCSEKVIEANWFFDKNDILANRLSLE
jgi:hypothetical protein